MAKPNKPSEAKDVSWPSSEPAATDVFGTKSSPSGEDTTTAFGATSSLAAEEGSGTEVKDLSGEEGVVITEGIEARANEARAEAAEDRAEAEGRAEAASEEAAEDASGNVRGERHCDTIGCIRPPHPATPFAHSFGLQRGTGDLVG